MKPVNIYALTRITDNERIERLERQMSCRGRFMKAKEWELESLKVFCDSLFKLAPETASMKFYYSFALPRLGKEFDLLRLDGESIINIELKSKAVSDESIRRQLMQNRYYLAMLGLNMHFFTLISSTGRLVRLSNSGRLVESDWDALLGLLSGQKACFEGDIEEKFKENRYLISPLTDPNRFLRGDYFLTSQQRDIKKKILKRIYAYVKNRNGGKAVPPVQGFTGLPGTGKTILLYDLAIELSGEKNVCIFHFGAHPEGIEQLNARLKRVDFYYCNTADPIVPEHSYQFIFLDEGHRLDDKTLDTIRALSAEWQAPVIVSYDSEMPIADEERKKRSTKSLEAIPGFIMYKLTNRIRLNNEMSAFIQSMVSLRGKNNRRDYPNVSLCYGGDAAEAKVLLKSFMTEGYTYIRDPLVEPDIMVDDSPTPSSDEGKMHAPGDTINISEATNREFDKVVMLVDNTFCYDSEGYLRSAVRSGDGRVRHLYHGLNRAKKKVAVIVMGNITFFDRLLGVLQRRQEG